MAKGYVLILAIAQMGFELIWEKISINPATCIKVVMAAIIGFLLGGIGFSHVVASYERKM